MATVEKPQPMDVDPKKVEEKPEEKTELVNIFFCRVIIQSNASSSFAEWISGNSCRTMMARCDCFLLS